MQGIMCSLTQTDFLPKDSPIDTDRPCIKCKVATSTINVHTAIYCDACFIDQVGHKFRLAMSKHRSPSGSRIAIALSGGLSSLCLLHLCMTVIPARSGLEFIPIHNGDSPALADYVLSRYNLKLVSKHLVEGAKELGCVQLLYGDNCVRMATNILTAVCTGRGDQVAGMQHSFSLQEMTIIYPMKEMSLVEIEHYARLHEIPNLETEAANSERTIESVTEAFLMGLVREHASTASTVTRTAAKIPMPPDASRCISCLGISDSVSCRHCDK